MQLAVVIPAPDALDEADRTAAFAACSPWAPEPRACLVVGAP